MAFVKLEPLVGKPYLSVDRIIDHLRLEFDWVEVDREEGRSHVNGMLAFAYRVSDEVPGKVERTKKWEAALDQSAWVSFGDSDASASCCLIPETELFFGDADAIAGAGRRIVQRAADALGYEVFEG